MPLTRLQVWPHSHLSASMAPAEGLGTELVEGRTGEELSMQREQRLESSPGVGTLGSTARQPQETQSRCTDSQTWTYQAGFWFLNLPFHCPNSGSRPRPQRYNLNLLLHLCGDLRSSIVSVTNELRDRLLHHLAGKIPRAS